MRPIIQFANPANSSTNKEGGFKFKLRLKSRSEGACRVSLSISSNTISFADGGKSVFKDVDVPNPNAYQDIEFDVRFIANASDVYFDNVSAKATNQSGESSLPQTISMKFDLKERSPMA